MDLAAALVAVEEHADLLRGKRGERGFKGGKGDPGKSIKGDKGDPGLPGESIKGDPGKSVRGEPGPRGIRGEPGRDGKSIRGDKGDPGKDGVGPDEKVRVSADDPKAGFLADKLTAGNGIEIRKAGGKRGEHLVIDARPQLSSGGGSSGILVYDDGVGVGAGDRISFDGGDPVTISGGIIRVPVGGGSLPGSPETYTETNVTPDRAYNANASTLDEVLDVLGTLIGDLRARGLVA